MDTVLSDFTRMCTYGWENDHGDDSKFKFTIAVFRDSAVKSVHLDKK